MIKDDCSHLPKAWQRYKCRHLDRVKKSKRKWKEKNPDHLKIYQFLYGHSSGTKRGNKRRIYWGFVNGDGCCLICGEYYPFCLEQHHLFEELEIQITLCSNCHSEFHRTKMFKGLLKDYEKGIFDDGD